MTKSLIAALLASALALASGPALGQDRTSSAATNVAPVTVTASRRPPPELDSRSANCSRAMRDPSLRALIAAGGQPRIYSATRPPRNPDYSAPPKSAPGSALPKVLSLKERQRLGRAMGMPQLGETLAPAAAEGEDGEGVTPSAAGGDLSLEAAVAQCMAGDFAGGGDTNMGWGFGADREVAPGAFPKPAFGEGRMHIKMNDKTLPLGFALFDEGRYGEALVQFKAAYKKLPDGQGGDEAALMIGKIYLDGLRDKNDPVQAVFWLKRAAGGRFDPSGQMPVFDPREPEANTAMGEASLILAGVYRTGRGPIAKDIGQTIKYLKRAVYVGHVPAAKMLGDLYYEGVETPRNLKLAFDNYMDGAKFAHPPAMNAVAHMYETGEAPGGFNMTKALAWRTQAATRANDPDSLYALAVAYDRGDGVEADPARALALYKLAAVNGQPAAQAAIGGYFYNGEAGMPQDLVLARKWFQHAALLADPEGTFNLAAMMARGEGGAVDRVKAWAWFRIADQEGHSKAAAAARALEAQMTPEERAGIAALSQK